jgi:hypothetical protein
LRRAQKKKGKDLEEEDLTMDKDSTRRNLIGQNHEYEVSQRHYSHLPAI